MNTTMNPPYGGAPAPTSADASANRDTADRIHIPRFEARPALIIGLGSAGTRIANQILERMAATYGSPANIPWVRVLCLETASIPADKIVKKYAQFEHLKIERASYQKLIAQLDDYKDKLDFESWYFPDVCASADSVVDGANGVRQLGRLALLFPDNYLKVARAIRDHVSALQSLTIAKASERLSEGLRRNAHADLRSSIYVYVVGSLCGGTCSGAFIDMGYMLQRIPGVALETTGVFLLPSTGESDDRKYGNAMAALMELNHFSSENVRYQAQFADQPGVPYVSPTAGERPYRYLYLAQSRLGDGREEYPRLLTATADYIYSDLIGSSATERDARRADISDFFVQRDVENATQKYLTFGLAGIEFPLAKVMKGCTLTLAQIGFQALLGGEDVTESQKRHLRDSILLAKRASLVRRLLQHENDSLTSRFNAVIAEAREPMTLSDDPGQLVREQLESAFTGQRPPAAHPKLSPGLVERVIADNARTARAELRKSLEDAMSELLKRPQDGGLRPARAFLKEMETQFAPGKAPDEATLAAMERSVSRAFASASQCRSDFFVAVTISRTAAVRRYVDEFIAASQSFYTEKLNRAAQPEADSIRSEMLETIQKMAARLTALEEEAGQIIGEMDDLYKRTDVKAGLDEWSRVPNGRELFTSNKTIPEEYIICLELYAVEKGLAGGADTLGKTLGRQAVAPWFLAQLPDVFAPTARTGRLDRTAGPVAPRNDAELLDLARPCEPIFDYLRRRTIVDRIESNPERDTMLEDLRGKSEMFLDMEAGNARNAPHPKKNYAFCFFTAEDPRSTELAERLRGPADIFQGMDGSTYIGDISDRHQLITLKERGAFSLATISPLDDGVPSNWWVAYHRPTGITTRHARADVKEWIGWGKSDERQRNELRELFLMGVAIGVIQFESATKYIFTYDTATSATDTRRLELSNDLDASISVLRNADKRGQLERAIQKFRERPSGDNELIASVDKFIKENDGLFVKGDQKISAEQLQTYLRSYMDKDTALKPLWEKVYPPDAAALNRKADETGRLAYFCPNCKRKLGYTADCLYITRTLQGRRITERKCVYCDSLIH